MKTKKWLAIGGVVLGYVGSIYGINRVALKLSTMKEILTSEEKAYYGWRFGNIFYSKKGSGSPVLLVHDLDCACSGYEWKEMIPMLAKNHTVYTIDLPGCGRSDKERIMYTNYLYVQAINDFVKHVIKQPTDIITSGASSSIGIMAIRSEGKLYNKMVMINPESFDHMVEKITTWEKIKRRIIELPLMGTLIYFASINKCHLKARFENDYYHDSTKVKSGDIDAFCEAGHLGGFKSRYIFASQVAHYTRINIVRALKEIDHSMYMICGSDLADKDKIMEGYAFFNKAIETSEVKETKGMPHMENPSEVFALCDLYLDD